MDILISSNLERLLHAYTYGDAELVKRYMEKLARTGSYQIEESVKKRMDRDFAAGCCDDDRAKAAIGRLWREEQYLIDLIPLWR